MIKLAYFKQNKHMIPKTKGRKRNKVKKKYVLKYVFRKVQISKSFNY